MEIRTVVTWIFGILSAAGLVAVAENYKEWLKRSGGNTLLVQVVDKILPTQLQKRLSWQYLHTAWWCWTIFGLGGGIVLTLWLTPLIYGLPTSPTIPKSAFLALDDGQKWRFSESLRKAAVTQNGELISCEFALGVSRPLQQFVWGVWTELQPMLDLAWWRHTSTGDRQPNEHQFPPGFTILAGTDKGPAFICAAALGRALRETLARTVPIAVHTNQVTEALSACNNNCVELNIGDFSAR
jgi:hypothetical protein